MKERRVGRFQFFVKPEAMTNINETTQMVLYPLVRHPKFGIVVRHITEPSAEEHMHTHGFPYVTWIMKGGYIEQRDDMDGRGIRKVLRNRFHINWIPQRTAHRIQSLLGDTWTIAFHMKWKAKPEHETGMLVDGEMIPIMDYYRRFRVRT